MPKLVFTHEVDDVAHWLASPKREEVFAGVATNIQTQVHLTEPNRIAPSMNVDGIDMALLALLDIHFFRIPLPCLQGNASSSYRVADNLIVFG